jgi:hypothetical protein
MTKEKAIEKALLIFAKLPLKECVDVLESVGSWVYDRIEEHEKHLEEEKNFYGSKKEKLTK